MRTIILLTALLLNAAPALAASPNPEAKAAYADMQATFGFVPDFMKVFPEQAIGPAWEQFKAISLNPKTAIPPKEKELIGLAVAAQVPCSYCTYAHTEFAKLNGATTDEIKHAVAQAAATRLFSTWLNGIQQSHSAFTAEISNTIKAMQAAAKANKAPQVIEVKDAESALADIKQTFGSVPTFLKEMPPEVLPSAWKQMKALEMSGGPVEAKYVSLISVGVASQIPCTYCVVADKEFAKMGGASDQEIKEAIYVAALTRHWSTYLNGMQYDEKKFRKDIDKIVAQVKKSKSPKTAAR